MGKYYKENNKRGYLNGRVLQSDSQLTLQDIDYGGGGKDRNIPRVSGKLMRLVIWGIQYPNPSAAPDREIVSAIWSGSGQIFNITRAKEGTEAGEHYAGDNIALLFTAGLSREILIFEEFEESVIGSLAYTEDTDEDGEMEVLALPPDDEVVTVTVPSSIKLCDSYVDGINCQKTVYWIGTKRVCFAQTFTPVENYNIVSTILKLYRTGLPGQVSVSIRATDITGKPTGPDLCGKTVNGNAITVDIGGEEVTFSFDSHLLVAGTKYAIILNPPANERTYVNWKINKADAGYSGGSVYISIDGGVTWTVDSIRRIICGGTVDEGYCSWRIDDCEEVYQNLLSGYDQTSYASVVCANGKFYTTKADDIWKFNKNGTVDTSFGINGVKSLGTMSVRDLALDSSENLYAVIYSSASPTGIDTIWKLDSNGNVIWSTYSLSLSRGCTSVVVGSDGYVYVAGSKPTGTYKRGMKINPSNGAVLVNYNFAGARHIAVDNFGYVYLSGSRTTYNLCRYTNDAASFWATDLGYFSLEDVLVQSGASASDTKVFVTGRDATNYKSVWKFNYDLSIKEAEYNANSSFNIAEDIDNNLLVSGNSNVTGEDGEYQIVKLRASDLLFMGGIKINDAGMKHVSRQVFSDPVGEDGDFYFKTFGFTSVVEKMYRKILVSGGVGNSPYWQFIWADEVGGTQQV